MNVRLTFTLICLYYGSALAQESVPGECTSIGNHDQCVSDANGVMLLQTNLRVTPPTIAKRSDLPRSSAKDAKEIALDSQGEVRSLVNARAHVNANGRWFSSRRRRRWAIESAIKDLGNTIADTVSDWADTVANTLADWADSAANEAQEILEKLVEEMEYAASVVFEALVPDCLKTGDVLGCFDSQTEDWLKTRVEAISEALDSGTSCFEAAGSNLADLADMVSDIECTDSVSLSYPSGIDFDFPPSLETSSFDLCTSVGGIDTSAMTKIFSTFQTCAETMYMIMVLAIDPSADTEASCDCPTTFGIYMGAALTIALVYTASLSAGFLVGCDGCNFKFSPFWSWYVGVTSNYAADIGGFLGFAITWDSFWGQALVVGASAGTPFGGADVTLGLGISLPSLEIYTETVTVDSGSLCVFDMCVELSVDIDNVPSGFDYTLPEFGTFDIGFAFGVGIMPVDVSAGFAECSEITSITLSVSYRRRSSTPRRRTTTTTTTTWSRRRTTTTTTTTTSVLSGTVYPSSSGYYSIKTGDGKCLQAVTSGGISSYTEGSRASITLIDCPSSTSAITEDEKFIVQMYNGYCYIRSYTNNAAMVMSTSSSSEAKAYVAIARRRRGVAFYGDLKLFQGSRRRKDTRRRGKWQIFDKWGVRLGFPNAGTAGDIMEKYYSTDWVFQRNGVATDYVEYSEDWDASSDCKS